MKKLIYLFLILCIAQAATYAAQMNTVQEQQQTLTPDEQDAVLQIFTILKNKEYLSQTELYKELDPILRQYPRIINAQNNEDSLTPIMRAIFHNYNKIVGLFLSHSASIEIKDINGFTPLIWAAWSGNPKIIMMLVAAGADTNIQNSKDQNKTARDYVQDTDMFDEAVRKGYNELQWQKENSKEREHKEKEEKCQSQNIEELNQALLHAAAHNDSSGIYSSLLAGAYIEAIDALDQNVLMLAARSLSFNVIDAIRADRSVSADTKKALAHAVDINGYTALMTLLEQSISGRNRGSIKVLEHFKDKNLVAKERQKMLEDVQQRKNKQEEILITLLAPPFNSDINVKTRTGMTPLMFAVAQGNEKVVAQLIGYITGYARGLYKENINAQDDGGTTALMIAAGTGNKNIVQMLLNAKANVNLRDAEGRTARHYAINNPEILKIIIAQEEENARAPLYTWAESWNNIENRSRQDVTTSQLINYLTSIEQIKNPTLEQQVTIKNMREELEQRRKRDEQQNVNNQPLARTFGPINRNIGPQINLHEGTISLSDLANENNELIQGAVFGAHPSERMQRLQAQFDRIGPGSLTWSALSELRAFLEGQNPQTQEQQARIKRVRDEIARRERERF